MDPSIGELDDLKFGRIPVLAAGLVLCGACAAVGPDVARYECERGGVLVIEKGEDLATFEFGGRRYRLPSAETVSGERWQRGDVLLRIHGGEASLTIGDQVVAWGCHRLESVHDD